MMKNRGTVIATDVRSWKLKDLKKRARRAGFSNISIRDWNGKGIPGRSANFDGVQVDAPCSATGTWRRNPDARWTSSSEELDCKQSFFRKTLAEVGNDFERKCRKPD